MINLPSLRPRLGAPMALIFLFSHSYFRHLGCCEGRFILWERIISRLELRILVEPNEFQIFNRPARKRKALFSVFYLVWTIHPVQWHWSCPKLIIEHLIGHFGSVMQLSHRLFLFEQFFWCLKLWFQIPCQKDIEWTLPYPVDIIAMVSIMTHNLWVRIYKQ